MDGRRRAPAAARRRGSGRSRRPCGARGTRCAGRGACRSGSTGRWRRPASAPRLDLADVDRHVAVGEARTAPTAAPCTTSAPASAAASSSIASKAARSTLSVSVSRWSRRPSEKSSWSGGVVGAEGELGAELVVVRHAVDALHSPSSRSSAQVAGQQRLADVEAREAGRARPPARRRRRAPAPTPPSPPPARRRRPRRRSGGGRGRQRRRNAPAWRGVTAAAARAGRGERLRARRPHVAPSPRRGRRPGVRSRGCGCRRSSCAPPGGRGRRR